jgi:hypothetical protein
MGLVWMCSIFAMFAHLVGLSGSSNNSRHPVASNEKSFGFMLFLSKMSAMPAEPEIESVAAKVPESFLFRLSGMLLAPRRREEAR